MKKKFFILRATSSSGPARLDYFDNEKKFKTGHPPKKSYHLHTVFNINKRTDSKHKFGIAIFLPSECFSVLADSLEEQEDWMNKMLEYQNEYLPQDEEPRPHYGKWFCLLFFWGLMPISFLSCFSYFLASD